MSFRTKKTLNLPSVQQNMLRYLCLLCLWLFATSSIAALPIVVPPPKINAKAFLLMDAHSGEIIMQKYPHKRMEPASITKVMTAYVALQEYRNRSLKDLVTISRKAYKAPGSRMFLEINSKVPVNEILRGIIIQSGNDASIAIAEHISADESSFAQLMNQYARKLGMKNTNFVNASGLPDSQHFTTAYDLALLAQAFILDFPEHYRLFAIKSMTYNGIKQSNRNRLLWRERSVDGIKTGHTKSAGFCLLASGLRNGTRFISVLLGANSDRSRTVESQKMLNYAFRYFQTYLIEPNAQKLNNTRIWYGNQQQIATGLNTEWYVTIPTRFADKINYTYAIKPFLEAPITKGDAIGVASAQVANQTISTMTIVALETVKKGSFFSNLMEHIRYFFQWLTHFIQ